MIIIKGIVDFEELSIHARNVRRMAIKMVSKAQTSHIGAALSIVDLLVVLYSNILNINPQNITSADRDRFILSKGHACSALYSVLAYNKLIPDSYLDEYCCNAGKLWGHPNFFSADSIEFSTGSLGHGLSVGTGMALAAKSDNRGYKTFVLLGDGECNEGQVWEAAMFAAQHKLDNLIAIIDLNKLQGFGRTNEIINMNSFFDTWMSFGWEGKEIDGHNLSEIYYTLKSIPFSKGKPNVIIAHTVKGKGVSFMEDKLEWHYKSPNAEQTDIALKEIGAK